MSQICLTLLQWFITWHILDLLPFVSTTNIISYYVSNYAKQPKGSFHNQRQNVIPVLKTLRWLPIFLRIGFSLSCGLLGPAGPSPALALLFTSAGSRSLRLSPVLCFVTMTYGLPLSQVLCIFCSLSKECFCYGHYLIPSLISFCSAGKAPVQRDLPWLNYLR